MEWTQSRTIRDIDDVIATWSAYFAQSGGNWKSLIAGVQPKEAGCALVYELDDPNDRPHEGLAIADMRALDFAAPHCHANGETEIYFVLQGTGAIVVGADVHEVGPDDVVVTWPGTAHYRFPMTNWCGVREGALIRGHLRV